MIDLKPYFDSARAADDEVQRIMNEMNTAFASGTDEGKTKALELRPTLDEAKGKAKAANELYISMRNASNTSNEVAKLFVPVAPAAAATSAPETKEMTRPDFQALDAAARMSYIKSGGKVIDPE